VLDFEETVVVAEGADVCVTGLGDPEVAAIWSGSAEVKCP